MVLINTLPAILDHLAEALSPEHPRRVATQNSTIATEHGGERVRLTRFRLEDLINEYRLLRQVLHQVLEEGGVLDVYERNTLNSSLDQVLMEACTGYALVQSSLRNELFSILAHDLRNPLSVADATARLILLQPSADEVSRWATRVLDSIGRADRMLQDLLDVMRLQSGARLELELEECDLAKVVRETLERFDLESADRLVLEAPEPVWGHFGPDALRRAVENLVVNAIKYGSSQQPITVTVRGEHERALILVHNHGSHIPPESQETLFRAFHRGTKEETGPRKGWGLGLTQARAVAEAHGGSIFVDSLPGAGTTFAIDIPADARPFQRALIAHRGDVA